MTITKAELLKRRSITPDARERIDAHKRAMTLEVALHQLRERRGVTQTAIAEHLATSRPNVSRIERETDIRLSTLERYVEALGGRLEIQAVFDDERVPLVTAEDA
jgi:transcriptional regulator with XRE-family HTH domain